MAKVMTMPPANVRNPLARCAGSWLFSDRPTCTMPKPSSIMPIARIRLKMKVERLFTALRGSSCAANAVAPKSANSTMRMVRAARVKVCLLVPGYGFSLLSEAKQLTTRYAGVRQKLHKKITFPL